MNSVLFAVSSLCDHLPATGVDQLRVSVGLHLSPLWYCPSAILPQIDSLILDTHQPTNAKFSWQSA